MPSQENLAGTNENPALRDTVPGGEERILKHLELVGSDPNATPPGYDEEGISARGQIIKAREAQRKDDQGFNF